MQSVSNLNINLFPVFLLIILWFNNRRYISDALGGKQFGSLLILTIISIVIGDLAWVVEDMTIPYQVPVVWLLNMGCLFTSGILSAAWLLYVFRRLEKNPWKSRGFERVIMITPLIIYFVLLVTSPWTQLILYVNEQAEYQRGPCFWFAYLIAIFYVVLATIYATYYMKREETYEKRREGIRLVLFPLPTIIAAVIQICFYGWWVMYPVWTLCLLYIYITIQNRRITTDALTGLNNRAHLERYLKLAEKDCSRVIMIMDMDGFKKINDELGHAVGDQALWEMANLLRETFREPDCFLSRFGGDEFVIICPCENEAEAEKLVQRLYAAVKEYNKTSRAQYYLAVSVGYMIWGKGEDNLEELFAKADEQMYRQKELRK